jgi:hypothetical protein
MRAIGGDGNAHRSWAYRPCGRRASSGRMAAHSSLRLSSSVCGNFMSARLLTAHVHSRGLERRSSAVGLAGGSWPPGLPPRCWLVATVTTRASRPVRAPSIRRSPAISPSPAPRRPISRSGTPPCAPRRRPPRCRSRRRQPRPQPRSRRAPWPCAARSRDRRRARLLPLPRQRPRPALRRPWRRLTPHPLQRRRPLRPPRRRASPSVPVLGSPAPPTPRSAP